MAKAKPALEHPDRKISDTLLQFAEPLLGAIGPQMTEADMEQPLRIAWIVWNAVVYADTGTNTHPMKTLHELLGPDPQIKNFVQFLIERKRTLFGDDHRLIGEYKLFRKGGEIRLQAEARDPYSKTK